MWLWSQTLGLAIVIHPMTGDGAAYGAKHSRIFLDQVLPVAPAITIQIAHLAGSGPGNGPDDAMAVFADAFEAHPRVANVYIDVTGIAMEDQPADVSALMARRMRQVGLEHVLFGSDMHPNPSPSEAWRVFRRESGLSPAELAAIADNVGPISSTTAAEARPVAVVPGATLSMRGSPGGDGRDRLTHSPPERCEGARKSGSGA